MEYCASPYVYQRRATREVKVGNVGIGGSNPIRVQSMITCDTMDTAASIQQTLDLAEVGCEIVRITAPTVKDAANLQHIVAGLRARGCNVPIVADIHFKPDAAMEAARWVEKVRVNPGNYADSKKFAVKEYTDSEYAAELDRIRERFSPLVKFCREHGRAMRIGTNHGSLSDRIMNRYGDSPLGMVESALEFARIAREYDYHQFVFSMKASNPKVMIEAYRLLVARLDEIANAECGMPIPNSEFRIPNSELLVLTPPPEQASHSSLVHMFETIRQKTGAPKSVFVGKTEADGVWTLNVDSALAALHSSPVTRHSSLLLGTAFSFVHLLDYLAENNLRFELPAGSRVMETGGYKNRSRTLPKAELHALITERLGVPRENIFCEYGMSELSSQAYAVAGDKWQVTRDAAASCHPSPVTRHFQFPPWARAQINSPETGREVAEGEAGLIRIFDLANVFSVAAIQTEDLAIRRGNGFELIGRAELAEPRGCSLMSV